MGEKNKIIEMKIKHSGLFDFRETYSFIYTLLSDMGYSVDETSYAEKTKGNQKDLEISWMAKRSVSDYLRFIIKIGIKTYRMTNVEVMKEGIKVPMNKGDFEIKLSAFLERDYDNKWEGTAFLKFLRGLYDHYIIKGTVDSYGGQLKDEVNELSNQTKALLDLSGKK